VDYRRGQRVWVEKPLGKSNFEDQAGQGNIILRGIVEG
jgi:hypothetical protein